MSEDPNNMQDMEHLPKARIRKSWKTYLFWLVPLGAALLAGWFIYTEVFKGGTKIHILFDDAGGLEPGKSQVKYRGMKIGSVDSVELTKDHHRVKVSATLHEAAESVAKEGTLFWIVQPQVGLDQIRGLRTIVSGDFITVQPGEGKRQTEFKGLSEPPVVAAKEATLRVVLLTDKLASLEKRTPVSYKGIPVGEVYDYDLDQLSQTVRISIDIKKRYAPLVRANSKFWNASGIKIHAGLTGVDINTQSMKSIVSSGIAFATPDTSEPPASSNTPFRLYDKPEEQWLGWAPPIPLHRHGSSDGSPGKEKK